MSTKVKLNGFFFVFLLFYRRKKSFLYGLFVGRFEVFCLPVAEFQKCEKKAVVAQPHSGTFGERTAGFFAIVPDPFVVSTVNPYKNDAL